MSLFSSLELTQKHDDLIHDTWNISEEQESLPHLFLSHLQPYVETYVFPIHLEPHKVYHSFVSTLFLTNTLVVIKPSTIILIVDPAFINKHRELTNFLVTNELLDLRT